MHDQLWQMYIIIPNYILHCSVPFKVFYSIWNMMYCIGLKYIVIWQILCLTLYGWESLGTIQFDLIPILGVMIRFKNYSQFNTNYGHHLGTFPIKHNGLDFLVFVVHSNMGNYWLLS